MIKVRSGCACDGKVSLCQIDSAWTCKWEWNIVERFAHLDWLGQNLMENLPVVANASF